MPTKAEQLAQIRALRKAGKTRFDTYEVAEEENLYETVDEEGYKKIVRSRLDQDDFVVDDNGEGYADDGREDWQDERRPLYETDSDEELGQPARGKAAKRKREEDEVRREKEKNGINKYFGSKAAAAAAPKPKPFVTAEDTAFMAGLLDDVDTNIPSRVPSYRKAVKSEDRRKTRVLSPPIERQRRALDDDPLPLRHETAKENLPTHAGAHDDDDGAYFPPPGDDDMVMSDPLPSSPAVKAAERKENATVKTEEVDEDDLMEVAEATGHSNVRVASVNMKGSRPALKAAPKPAYPTPDSSSPSRALAEDLDMTSINAVTEKLNVLSSPEPESVSAGKIQSKDALEDDGTLRFFWTDYTEINGNLCLFGKVKDRSSSQYVSCFVKVDNILRKLYFLPREYRRKNGRETEEEVGMGDVYEEVDKLMSKMKVGMYKAKPCSRRYAFELPDIPKEADYLKLLYPYEKPQLAMDLKGETYARVFGTNTALFEQFVMWKNIMGPCWLKIEQGNFNAVNNASWCKLELQVDKPSLITTLGESDNLEAPPLTLMSMALRTTMNVKENKNEILVASLRIYNNVALTDTTPPEKLPSRTFTVMRPNGKDYPIGFKAEADKRNGQIRMEKSEQALLSMLMAQIQRYDPDVFIGHRLDDVDYSVLLSRMRDRKTPGWHRIGRLKRSDWPKNTGKGGGSFNFAERHLAAGRLLCDIANDQGKSVTQKCLQWSLDEMCDLYLGGQKRREIDNEKALAMTATPEGLMNYVKLCEADTFFIAALALKQQMLPLSKVLTNLAGNSWARTLAGTRAERNEYILLHEFYRGKYICPDKVYGRPQQKSDEEHPDGEDAVTDGKRGKAKFTGGLVFEPEKGLYDKFVLVMDFNSLYPSIIQEFNICFTTVDRSGIGEDDDRVPDVPGDTAQKGVFPRLIKTLVSRRREVKKLMKDKTATDEQKAIWDVKQNALKITANSMYGCLGYNKSRFYARPLAALTTSKGREILRSTKELAESAHALRVIYGDTDSVMVNTNVDNIQDAIKMGNDFKKSVNERYELLEIDIDNIFRRLLLHAKKKYAAVNMIEVDGKWIDKLEVKGLDMKRREYCGLSKDTSAELLNFLLSGQEPEQVVSQIHAHLRDLADRMRSQAVPLHKYTIYTQLGKDPKDYPNGNSMPSVQVAFKLMARGKPVKAKDVMSFVICGANNGSAEQAAKNAYPLDDVLARDSPLVPDADYYLHKQILPPVERLCAPIDGTNVALLAECLGLDTAKYRISAVSKSAEHSAAITRLESQLPDALRFQACDALALRCLACKRRFEFRGLDAAAAADDEAPPIPLAALTTAGLACPRPHCNAPLPTLALVAQLESQLRAHTSRYYAAWLMCDDPACGARTRSMSVYGRRCLGPAGLARGCSGRMALEYGEKALYTQLLFLRAVFDVEKFARGGGGEERDKLALLAGGNRERFGTVGGVVDGYLERSGWGWVSMDALFGFARRGGG